MTERKFELTIEGMTCGGCVRRVSAALKGIESVDLAVVDVGKASGFYDDTDGTVLGDLVTAVDKLGFKAQGTEESPS
ncbi:MAG: cation transporter [Deltaproteobacteria bacterium]|nr:cation transporter [Deltaproteobacteria bacterium]